jgi:hypothetical protein
VPLVAASFLISASGLAPLHAHESAATHSHAVLHSHFEPHHHVAHHADGEREIEAGDHVVWLETVAVHALPFQFHVPSAVLTRVPDLVARSRCWSVIAFDDSAPPHGPPRAGASLRAPPFPSA